MGTGALSLGVKRPGREADHSHASSVEVKNAWSCTSTPPDVFQARAYLSTGTTFTELQKIYLVDFRQIITELEEIRI
jgi:hypothetical protein